MPEGTGIAPVPDWESQAYWDGSAAGRLLIKRCTACGACHWYPRPHCPWCHADGTEWLESSGRGRIHTFTIIRQNQSRAFRGWSPYAVGMIELEEGPLVFSLIRGPLDQVTIDAPVAVSFEQFEGWVSPTFVLSSSESHQPI